MKLIKLLRGSMFNQNEFNEIPWIKKERRKMEANREKESGTLVIDSSSHRVKICQVEDVRDC